MPITTALAGAGLALDLGKSVYGMLAGGAQARQGRRFLQQAGDRPLATINPEIEQMMVARQLGLNAVPQANLLARQQILANQAGTNFNTRQGATSSPQVLSMLGATQANTNQALLQQQMLEDEQFQRRLSGLENAQAAVGADRNRVFAENAARYNQLTQMGLGLQAGGQSNIFGALDALSGTAADLYDAEQANEVISRLFKIGNYRRAPKMKGTI